MRGGSETASTPTSTVTDPHLNGAYPRLDEGAMAIRLAFERTRPG